MILVALVCAEAYIHIVVIVIKTSAVIKIVMDDVRCSITEFHCIVPSAVFVISVILFSLVFFLILLGINPVIVPITVGIFQCFFWFYHDFFDWKCCNCSIEFCFIVTHFSSYLVGLAWFPLICKALVCIEINIYELVTVIETRCLFFLFFICAHIIIGTITKLYCEVVVLRIVIVIFSAFCVCPVTIGSFQDFQWLKYDFCKRKFDNGARESVLEF